MTIIEQALERMKKVESACDELLLMAEPEIKELRRRKNNAQLIIKGLTMFNIAPDSDCKKLTELTAKRIVNEKTASVSCLGIEIKIK